MAPIFVAIEGAERFKRLSRDLKAAGRGDLKKRLRREIRDAGKPVVRDVARAALASGFTSTRGGTARPDTSTNLRSRVAKATQLSVTQRGIRIKVNERKLGPYGASMPRYLDGTLRNYRRLRHPVFGNRDVWVAQSGTGFFFETINRHSADFRRAIFGAMDATISELEQ